jgi:1D-myo-inositol-tetrakisphosphate 5-kinase/inositol-polyphosphate multikinase
MSFVPFQHKAAGHDGPMQTVDGSLFIKPTTTQEIDFYNKTQAKKMAISDDVLYGNSLSDWMPQYVGVLYPGASNDLIRESNGAIDANLLIKATDTLEIEGDNKQYLILNNCLNGFSQPSILDIKLGSVLYDSNANEDKKKRMHHVSKTTTSGSLQFRIAGMIIKNDYDDKLPEDISGFNMSDVCSTAIETGYITFNKYFGRKLTKETVNEGLKFFFRYNKLPEKVQNTIIGNFYARLQLLYNCLLDEEIRVVSGSLLFVFENDLTRWEASDYNDPILTEPTISDEDEDEESDDDDDDDNIETSTLLSCLKFIDFAHASYTPGKGYDEEIVSGIENLFSIIENI